MNQNELLGSQSLQLLKDSTAMQNELLPLLNEGLDSLIEYKEIRMRYLCAIKEIKTKFDVLSTEFGVRYDRNPISSISTRLKNTSGILEKMRRQNIPPSLKNMQENIRDIAGVRVICSYIDDIYLLAEALVRQKDITLLAQKDYIKNPKPNGYRSLHLIVSVPVFFADESRDMTVEVQIRTIAMDFWASLEHELRYKKNVAHSADISDELRLCAETIAQTDRKMQQIRQQIEADSAEPSDEEELLRKLKNIDTPIQTF